MDRAQTDVPACCKKGGTHTCSVRRTKPPEKDGKPGVRAICPFASHSNPAVVGHRTFIPNVVRSSTAFVLQHNDFIPGEQISSSSVVSPANPKRGPPVPVL